MTTKKKTNTNAIRNINDNFAYLTFILFKFPFGNMHGNKINTSIDYLIDNRIFYIRKFMKNWIIDFNLRTMNIIEVLVREQKKKKI